MIGTQFSAAASVLHATAALLQAHVAPGDSIVVESPLPGGIAKVVRFLLNTVPPWVQAGGVVAGAVVGAILLWFLFVRRRTIRGWLGSRTSGVRLVLAAAALVLIASAATVGTATWNYTQHSNNFCTGCHVMNPAFERMAMVESKHGKLSCHACHQQSVYASARQLYVWIAERPEKIGKHAKVANKVCETCHVTADTAVWQRIAATAGHRVHLESDSSALKEMQCVSCHGVEAHRFKPVNLTCGQSNCHAPKETGIVLGKMAGQTVRHCTSCHEFAAGVPALATRDSARATLLPGVSQCLGCHEMQKVLKDFNEQKDPHAGKCGMCHNPHTEKTPALAVNSCATSGCHANWRDEPFHVGASHRRVGSQCLTCHRPHSATADASECESCHLGVRARSTRRPPLPFDTAAALRRTQTGEHRIRVGFQVTAPASVRLAFAAFDRTPSASGHDAFRLAFDPPPPVETAHLAAGPPRAPPAAPDSFPHSRHEKLACLECHETGTGHGRLTFERPRGCAICHHQAPARGRCASCHSGGEYASPKQMTAVVTVPGNPPKPRPVEFLHSAHTKRTCLECHTTPVTLTPSRAKAECRDCHADHHAAGRTCTTCHTVAQPASAHKTLEDAHQRCDACHTATTIAKLTPTRSLCSTCHTAKSKDHYDSKECTACHFLADPAAYRSELITRARE